MQLVREDETVGAGAVTLYGLFRPDSLSVSLSLDFAVHSPCLPQTHLFFLIYTHSLVSITGYTSAREGLFFMFSSG